MTAYILTNKLIIQTQKGKQCRNRFAIIFTFVFVDPLLLTYKYPYRGLFYHFNSKRDRKKIDTHFQPLYQTLKLSIKNDCFQ